MDFSIISRVILIQRPYIRRSQIWVSIVIYLFIWFSFVLNFAVKKYPFAIFIGLFDGVWRLRANFFIFFYFGIQRVDGDVGKDYWSSKELIGTRAFPHVLTSFFLSFSSEAYCFIVFFWFITSSLSFTLSILDSQFLFQLCSHKKVY